MPEDFLFVLDPSAGRFWPAGRMFDSPDLKEAALKHDRLPVRKEQVRVRH